VQSVKTQADTPVYAALEHPTKFDQLDHGLVLCRQGHFGHRFGVVKVQHVNTSLVVGPENTGPAGDALHRGAEAGCRAVEPDLEYRRSDGDKRDRSSARAERAVQPQRAIKKINRNHGAEAVAYDQQFVRFGFFGRFGDFDGQAFHSSLDGRTALSNILAGKNPVVEKTAQVQPAPGTKQKRCQREQTDCDGDGD
jgi:hypothetical protein